MRNSYALAAALSLSFVLAGCSSSPKPATDTASEKTSTEKTTVVNPTPPTGGRFADFAKEEMRLKHQKGDKNGLMTCSNKDETRTLSIAPKEGGCELVYEKSGKLNVPAYSAHGTEHCFNAREKIRKRLVSTGYKCSL